MAGTHYVTDRGNGRWLLRTQWMDGGKRRSKSTTVSASSRSQAYGKLYEWLSELGHNVDGIKPTTLSDLVESHLVATAHRRQARSDDAARRLHRLHVSPYEIGDELCTEISALDLEEHYAVLAKQMAPGTIRHVHFLIHAAYKTGIRVGEIDRNPAEFVELPRLERTRAEIPSASDLAAATSQIQSDVVRTFLHLAVVTGARRSELAGICWGDIDWASGILTIRRSLSVPDDGQIRVKLPKTGKIRTVGLPDETLIRLERFSQSKPVLAEDHHYVFDSCGEGVHPHRPEVFSQAWRRACCRAGVHIRLHDLRHVVASVLLADEGADILEAQNQLGHAKPTTTLDVYGHLLADAERQRELAGKLANRLGHLL